MTEIVEPGGLIGAFRRTGRGIASVTMSIWNKPDRVLMSCAILASVISVVYFSGDKAKSFWPQMILICLGLAAVGFHIRGAQNACRAWFDRSLPRFALWTVVALAAFAWEVNSQLSISSNNQGQLAEAQKADFRKSDSVKSRFDMAKSNLATATKALDAAKAAAWEAMPLVGGKSVSSLDEVNAIIAAKKGDSLWKATDGCTDKVNKKQREFCAPYEEAQRAVGALKSREGVKGATADAEASHVKAKAEFDAAMAAMNMTKVASTEDRADTRNFIKAANFVGFKPADDDVELIQSMLMPITLGIFLFVAAWLMKAEEYAGKQVRPWINFRRIKDSIWEILTGKPLTSVHRTTIIRDARTVAEMGA